MMSITCASQMTGTWILTLLAEKKGRKTPREEKRRGGPVVLGVQSWTEKMAEDFTRTAKSK